MIAFINSLRNLFTPAINDTKTFIYTNSLGGKKVNLGYLEHDDTITGINKQNINFADTFMADAAPHGDVSVRKYFKPVSNQEFLGSCHDDQTEILTENGWFLFKNINNQMKLATINPETSELYYVLPTNLTRFNYSGDMICGKNKNTLDFKVTPDHKMLIKTWNEPERKLNSYYDFIDAKNIGWYCGLMNRIVWNGNNPEEYFILKGIPHKHKPQRQDKKIQMCIWLKFLGLYLAEGTIIKDKNPPTKSISKIQIAAFKPREKEFAKQVFLEMNIHATEYIDRFVINNKQLKTTLTSLGLKGIKAPQKFVPDFVFNQTKENIKMFLLGHFMGDGCEDFNNGCKAHYTSSKKLANDLQRLIFLSGNESTISTRPPRTSVMKDGRVVCGKYPEHRISVRENKQLSIDKKRYIHTEPYVGEVFCAEIQPYHTLITRRNGKILISGNCTANATADASEAEQARFFGVSPSEIQDISRLFIYWNARNNQNPPAGGIDKGSFISLAFDSIKRYGVPPEKYWTYDTAKVFTHPSPLAYAKAYAVKINNYYSINSSGDNRIADVIRALNSGRSVVFGTKINEAYRAIRGKQIVNPPSGNYIGGHAQCCTAWIESENLFEVRNSWGEDWGDKGYTYFTPAYIKASITHDLFVATL